MSNKGVQNAQLQGPAARPKDTPDTGACWWNIYAEGDPSTDGLNKF